MKEPMGPVEALKFALEKEIEAYNMYQKLAEETKPRQLAKFLYFCPTRKESTRN